MRPGFTSRFRRWIRVLATGRMLLFQVGSRYLKAISNRHEDRELQKEELEVPDQLLAYGDGGNWVGRAQLQAQVTVTWQVDFDSSSSSVEIYIADGHDAAAVAQNLLAAWKAVYDNEASIYTSKPSTVRFIRKGQKPRCMSIKVGPGVQQTLPEDGTVVFVVAGLDVKNAQ